MSYIKLYDKKLNEYKLWLHDLHNLLLAVEENILQNDNSDKIEEKLVSIGISSVFVSIGSGLASLFGIVAIGLSGGLVLFIIGWILSKGVNKKVFGNERKLDNINEDEKKLLSGKNYVITYFRPIEKKIKIKKLRKQVAFTNYIDIKDTLTHFLIYLKEYDSSNLAIKYQRRHSNTIKKYILSINQFDKIYTSTVKNK